MGRNEEMSKFSFCSRILLTSHSTFCPFYLWIRFQMAPRLMELKALMSGIFLFFFLSYGFEFFNRKCTNVTCHRVKRLESWLYMQCNFNVQYKFLGVDKKMMRLCVWGQMCEQRLVCLLQTSWQPFGQKEHFQSVALNHLTLKKTSHVIGIPLSFLLFAMHVRMYVVFNMLKCPCWSVVSNLEK